MRKSILFFALLALSSSLVYANEFTQVTNSKISCSGANGVKIESKKNSPNEVTATWLGKSVDYSFVLNPSYYQWTWIALGVADKATYAGYHIFLFGNPEAGKTTTLYGSVGHIVSTPTIGGMSYPLGYVPHSTITCQVYWEKK